MVNSILQYIEPQLKAYMQFLNRVDSPVFRISNGEMIKGNGQEKEVVTISDLNGNSLYIRQTQPETINERKALSSCDKEYNISARCKVVFYSFGGNDFTINPDKVKSKIVNTLARLDFSHYAGSSTEIKIDVNGTSLDMEKIYTEETGKQFEGNVWPTLVTVDFTLSYVDTNCNTCDIDDNETVITWTPDLTPENCETKAICEVISKCDVITLLQEQTASLQEQIDNLPQSGLTCTDLPNCQTIIDILQSINDIVSGLPSSYFSCGDLAVCQTIIDIESGIDDLQQQIDNLPITEPLGLIKIVDLDGDFFTDLATATTYIEQFFTDPTIITDKSFNEGVFFFTVPENTSMDVNLTFLSNLDGVTFNTASFIDNFGLITSFLGASSFQLTNGKFIFGGDVEFIDFCFYNSNAYVEINNLQSTLGADYLFSDSNATVKIFGNIGENETANFGATFFSGSTATIFANASKYTSNAGGIHGDLQTAIANGCNVQFDGINLEKVSNKQTDLTASATNYPTVNAVNAGLATKGTFQGFFSGKWKTIPFASAPTGLTGWVGAIVYIPIPIGETQIFTKIGEEVTTGIASQNIRLALYRSVNGLPATLIEDSGNLSAVTNGLKHFTFTSPVTVNAIEKQVFAAIQVSNNSIGLRVANSVCLNYFNGSGLTGSLFYQVQAFGAFTANATPVAYNNVISPLVSLLMQ